MANADSLPRTLPKITAAPGAIPPVFFNVCFVLLVINVSLFPAAYFSHAWIYDEKGLGVPTDFVNVWAAGKLVLDGHPALAYDWDIQKQVELALLEHDFIGYFAWHYPPPFLFVAAFLAQFPYAVAFIGWVSVSLVPYLAVMRAIVGRPSAGACARISDGAQQYPRRPERISHRGADRRHALSDAGAAGAVGHLPRAAQLQAAIRPAVSAGADRGVRMDGVLQRGVTAIALAFASWLAFGTESWQAFFHWMPMFSQAFLTEGKATWWKLQSIFALVRYSGGSEQLAWAFQWIVSGRLRSCWR